MSQSSGRPSFRVVACATRVEDARPGRGEDRIAVVELPDRTLVVVADGAGGVSGGAEAAEAICRALTKDEPDWTAWLADRDAALAATSRGLAAAVVLSISADGTVAGASVGDCEAWVFRDGAAASLTDRQVRKPMIGSGGARPVAFASNVAGGTLVVGSDGLWKYAPHSRMVEAAAMRPVDAAAVALLDRARLRSGALQDDVAVVVCEVFRA
jgi:serine/threonine protein phosphatase PrpC